MIRTYALAALAAASIVATPAMAAEFVTNGGFENVSNNTSNFQVDVGNIYGSVAGWTTTAAPSGNPYNILFHTSIATSGNAIGEYSGSLQEYLWQLPSNTTNREGNFMALDGDVNVNGNFFTTLTGLVIGDTYDLSFDWATGQLRSRVGETQEGLNVQVGSLNTFFGPTLTPDMGSTPWVSVTTQFQATATTQVLSFLAIGSPTGLPPVALLDNVSVKQAVPEPGTWAMMLIGFGAVGASLRFRRRTTLTAAA